MRNLGRANPKGKLNGSILLALLSLLALSGCMVLRTGGPCYGVGCHAFAAPQASQARSVAPSNNTQAQNTPAANTEAQNTQPAASTPQQAHGVKALLHKVKL